MLLIVQKLHQLSFGALMEIYRDANREHGAELAPEESPERQIALSEQEFYAYLRDDFFTRENCTYYIWQKDGRYVSALRLEPFRDGLLLEALETAPDQRSRGYATQLIGSVLQLLAQQGGVRLYSHVNKRNRASLRVHRACGFAVRLDYAAFIDGSVNRQAYTLCLEKNFADFGKKELTNPTP